MSGSVQWTEITSLQLTTQFVAHKLSWFSTDHVGVLLPKIKKIHKNTNGRLAIPAPAGLLVQKGLAIVLFTPTILFVWCIYHVSEVL